jgi:predicted RNA-binding protein
MNNDDLIEKLGQSQQKVMSLTVQCRRLEMAEQRARERAEVLEELIMDVVADCREGARDYEIEYRISKVMQRLDADG